MENEICKKKTTAPDTSVGADDGQPLHNSTENSISAFEEEINGDFQSSAESLDEIYRRIQRLTDPHYPEMLAARSVVISCWMFGALVLLSVMLHITASEAFLRLALCGAVPGIYLCTLLLFLSARLRNPEGLSLLALVFWAALCFLVTVLPFDRLLQLCSTAAYAALAVIGLILYGILIFNVQRRREHYDMAHIG